MSPCKDENLCKGTTLRFSEKPDPEIHGPIDHNRDSEEHYCATDDHFELCARSGLQVLYMQGVILRLLLQCSKENQHDITWKNILQFNVAVEPALSDILDRDEGQANFTDILMLAPSRGWHSQNISKLRKYVTAGLDTQKERFLSLRENPSCFADTLSEYEEHMPYKGKCTNANTNSRPCQSGTIQEYRNIVLELIVDEAYCMLAAWSQLDRQFAHLEVLQGNPDMHAQVHAVEEISVLAENTMHFLTMRLGESYYAAPNIRKNLRYVGEDGAPGSFLEPIKPLTVSQQFNWINSRAGKITRS